MIDTLNYARNFIWQPQSLNLINTKLMFLMDNRSFDLIQWLVWDCPQKKEVSISGEWIKYGFDREVQMRIVEMERPRKNSRVVNIGITFLKTGDI